MSRTSFYSRMIETILASMGRKDIDPRHVEAMIRNEHPTLDHLEPARFRYETRLAVKCIDQSPAGDAEALARSYGL